MYTTTLKADFFFSNYVRKLEFIFPEVHKSMACLEKALYNRVQDDSKSLCARHSCHRLDRILNFNSLELFQIRLCKQEFSSYSTSITSSTKARNSAIVFSSLISLMQVITKVTFKFFISFVIKRMKSFTTSNLL